MPYSGRSRLGGSMLSKSRRSGREANASRSQSSPRHKQLHSVERPPGVGPIQGRNQTLGPIQQLLPAHAQRQFPAIAVPSHQIQEQVLQSPCGFLRSRVPGSPRTGSWRPAFPRTPARGCRSRCWRTRRNRCSRKVSSAPVSPRRLGTAAVARMFCSVCCRMRYSPPTSRITCSPILMRFRFSPRCQSS